MSAQQNTSDFNSEEKRPLSQEYKAIKPIRVSKKHHRKSEESKYSFMKVYSTSNKSSRERLQKIIKESKENASISIPWDEILC